MATLDRLLSTSISVRWIDYPLTAAFPEDASPRLDMLATADIEPLTEGVGGAMR
jgi:hypothetical protein